MSTGQKGELTQVLIGVLQVYASTSDHHEIETTRKFIQKRKDIHLQCLFKCLVKCLFK